MSKVLYLEITTDEYELPIVVAESVPELAKLSGASINAIRSALCRQRNGKLKNSRFREVRI